MREIKFRAWDKEYKHMLLDMEEQPLSTLDKDRFIIEQYTELKDKNGKEIYEGDVIQCAIYPNGKKKEYLRLVYDFVKLPCEEYGNFIGYPDFTEYKELKIIGNIHETTKEQLKEWGVRK